MVQVRNWNLLDLKDIVAVEDGLEVLSREEDGLELVQAVVVWVSLVELLALDGLQHFEDGGLGVSGLLIQDVGHEFLRGKISKKS